MMVPSVPPARVKPFARSGLLLMNSLLTSSH
jgi:hypothetical protein